MIQLRENSGFLSEAPAHPVFRRPEVVQQLDDDPTRRDLLVTGFEHDSRAPSPEHALQAITPGDLLPQPGVLPPRTAVLQEPPGAHMPGNQPEQVWTAPRGDASQRIGRFQCFGQPLRELVPTRPDHAWSP